MSKISRINHHNHLGSFDELDLPTDTSVEVGDTLFNTTIQDLMVCTEDGPVVWDVAGASISTAIGSLDDAYDNGGSGSGRIINIDSGEVDLNILSGNKAISARIGTGEVASLGRIGSDGILNIRQDTGARSVDVTPSSIAFSVGANPITISNTGNILIDSTASVILDSASNLQFVSANNDLNLEQNSSAFGSSLLNASGELLHSSGAIGSIVGETSASIIHSINSLANAISTLKGSDSGTIKNGVQNIPVSSEAVSVSFTTAFPSNNYAVVATIQNDALSFEHITAVAKNKTASGFTVTLSNRVPTSDYKVNWIARLN